MTYQISKTLKDPKVFEYLNQYKIGDFVFKKDTIFETYVKVYKQWLSENGSIKITNLDCFPYVYFTNGICEAIEAVVSNSGYRLFSAFLGDFPYYEFAVKTNHKKWINSSETFSSNKCLYFISNPQYKNGLFKPNLLKILPNERHLFYDMAYIGCCFWKGQITVPENVKFLAFSLSKTFGLEDYRLGVLFSKKKLPILDIRHKLKYINNHSMMIATYMMKQFGISYLPDKYRKLYKDICRKNNLTETDCPWMAFLDGKKVNTSDYFFKKK